VHYDHIIHIEWTESKAGKDWAGWFVRFVTDEEKNPPEVKADQPILFNKPQVKYMLTPEEKKQVGAYLKSQKKAKKGTKRLLRAIRPLPLRHETRQGK